MSSVTIFQPDQFVLSTIYSSNLTFHKIDWNNVKILKSESHAYRRRVAESFSINQKACLCNVINRNDGANFPAVYRVFITNKYCLMYLTTLFTCPLLYL